MGTKYLRLISWMSVALLASACADKRQASFPGTTGEEIYALSEFNAPDAVPSQTITMQPEGQIMNFGEAALATSEKGLTAVDMNAVNVNGRFRYMFEDLVLQGSPGRTHRVLFVADRNNLTVYRLLENPEDLTLLEQEMLTTPAQIKSELELQKSRTMSQSNLLLSKIREQKAIARERESVYLVPMFQIPVESFGVVERTKNELKEETSTLQLAKTSWEQATHVKIPKDISKRKIFGVTDAFREKMADVFLASRLHEKSLTVAQMATDLKLHADLPENTPVALQIENGEKEKTLNVMLQTETGLKKYATASITFKRVKLPEPKLNGTRASELTLEDVPAGQSSELVQLKRELKLVEEKKAETGAAVPAK